MNRLGSLFVCLASLLLAACAPQAPAPAPPNSAPVGESPLPTPATAILHLALVPGSSASAARIEQGARQVVGANAVQLDVVASAAALAAEARGVILVGPTAEDLAAAVGHGAKVVVIGPAPGEADAVLGSDANLSSLSESQAIELGRVGVETAASLVEGQGGLTPRRTLADIMRPR